MKFFIELFKKVRHRIAPQSYGHVVVIDRRTHEHLTMGWHQACNPNAKLHWMIMAADVQEFIGARGGRVLPNNLEGLSTFYDFPPSEHEQDQYMLHRISFPDEESVVMFKLRFM